MSRYTSIVLLVGIATVSLSCSREPGKRTYTEISKTPEATEPETDSTPITWEAPSGWRAEPGDSIRLASYALGDGDRECQAWIVVLGGTGGGLEANVTRWFGQLGLDPPSPEDLKAFLVAQKHLTSADGLVVTVIDFTGVAKDEAEAMLAAIVDLGDRTAFLKLTGPTPAVRDARMAFREWCASLARKAP